MATHRKPYRRQCPVCGERITITGHTKDGRSIGSCGDAFWPSRAGKERTLAATPCDKCGQPNDRADVGNYCTRCHDEYQRRVAANYETRPVGDERRRP